MDVTVAVLAGGLGSRIGGDKALVRLAGRPLISYALSAADDAGLPAVIVAKRATKLPPVTAQLLLEPDEPTHPLLGIITALEHHPAIIALPSDMPLVTAAQLAALALMPAAIATLWRGEPFPALYRRQVRPQLMTALEASASMRSTQALASAPAAIASRRPAQQLSVNTPEDLARAEAILRNR